MDESHARASAQNYPSYEDLVSAEGYLGRLHIALYFSAWLVIEYDGKPPDTPISLVLKQAKVESLRALAAPIFGATISLAVLRERS